MRVKKIFEMISLKIIQIFRGVQIDKTPFPTALTTPEMMPQHCPQVDMSKYADQAEGYILSEEAQREQRSKILKISAEEAEEEAIIKRAAVIYEKKEAGEPISDEEQQILNRAYCLLAERKLKHYQSCDFINNLNLLTVFTSSHRGEYLDKKRNIHEEINVSEAEVGKSKKMIEESERKIEDKKTESIKKIQIEKTQEKGGKYSHGHTYIFIYECIVYYLENKLEYEKFNKRFCGDEVSKDILKNNRSNEKNKSKISSWVNEYIKYDEKICNYIANNDKLFSNIPDDEEKEERFYLKNYQKISEEIKEKISIKVSVGKISAWLKAHHKLSKDKEKI